MQSALSIAYLYAVIGKVNYAINGTSKPYDDVGIDYEVINHTMGKNRRVASESSEIKIQLKSVCSSSTSVLQDEVDHIKYKLDTQLNTYGVNSYLVIVQLPERGKLDSWVDIKPEELILRKCAYYFKIPHPCLEPGVIKIPKTNIFDHNSIRTLFVSNQNKEDLF